MTVFAHSMGSSVPVQVQVYDPTGTLVHTFVLANVIDRDDIGMAQGGQGLGLATEAIEPLLVGGCLRRQDLEGHLALDT